MNEKLYRKIMENHPGVTVVVASKYLKTKTDFAPFLDAGIRDFGENRVETLKAKRLMVPDPTIRWHFIGTLQTKKVKTALPLMNCLQSLDRLKLAEEIEKRHDGVLPCYAQVNISGEPQKHGLSPAEAETFIHCVSAFKHLRVIGLMGMAEETEDTERLAAQFALLRTLRDRLRTEHPDLSGLSMGMSDDYEIALEHGATVLRLGRILLAEGNHG